jgi:hypothetical protein
MEPATTQVPVIPLLDVVGSSNVTGVGYDAATRTLDVRFTTGVYRFAGVPPQVFDDFMAAESKGSFFAKSIRGKFTSTKLDPQPKESGA